LSETPSEVMRRLRATLGITVDDLASAVSEFHDRVISLETVNRWLNGDTPVQPRHRKAFLKWLATQRRVIEPEVWQKRFLESWTAQAAEGRVDTLFARHHKWIAQRYRSPLMGETFSLAEVYTPIRAIFQEEKNPLVPPAINLSDRQVIGFAKGLRVADGRGGTLPDWLFVKGGPGSGKSALALNVADALTRERTGVVLFLRGARLAGEKSEAIPPGSAPIDDSLPLELLLRRFAKSTRRRLTVVIDGLDEIGRYTAQNRASIRQILDSLHQQAELLRARGKIVRVLVFGRETLTHVAARLFAGTARLLEMGDLSGQLVDADGIGHRYDPLDRRPEWWRRFARGRGVDCDGRVPRFLVDPGHSLYPISREPLLAFLVVRAAWPATGAPAEDGAEVVARIDRYAEGKNRNQIYADILDRVRTGSDWKEEASALLPARDFVEVLRRIALAAWRNGSLRSVSVGEVRAIIHDAPTRAAFDSLLAQLGEESPATLLTAFYYRIERSPFEPVRAAAAHDFEIEFTHKTFAEYLLVTFLLDRLEELLAPDNGVQPAHARARRQQEFLDFVMEGAQSSEIMRFVLDEARIRFEASATLVRDNSYRLLDEIRRLNPVCATGVTWLATGSAAGRVTRGGQFLLLLWAAMNRIRFELEGKRHRFGSAGLGAYDLQELATPFSLGVARIEHGAIEGIVPRNFMAPTLSGLDWREGDFPGLYASGGELMGSAFTECMFEGLVLHDLGLHQTRFASCSLRRARFDAVGIESCSFVLTTLSQSILHDSVFQDCPMRGLDFTRSELLNVHFVGCDLDEVSFAHCTLADCEFIDCRFGQCDFGATAIETIRFSGCSFLGLARADLPVEEAALEDCSFREETSDQ